MSERATLICGIVAGLVFAGLSLLLGPRYVTLLGVATDTVAERIAFAIRLEVFVLLPLLAGVVAVAQQRFYSSRRLDGSAPQTGSSMEINLRYLANTVEQTLLAFVAHVAFVVVAPMESLVVLPVLVTLFVIGRAAFWVGYLLSPFARSFGFVTTFIPTVGLYVYLLGQLV